MPKDIAQRIAKGDLDPITKMPFEVHHQFLLYIHPYQSVCVLN